MKLEKRVNNELGLDQYTLYISHDEASQAFEHMTPLEKGMLHELQQSSNVSSVLKVLSLWAVRIEETKGVLGKPHHGGEQINEG